MRRRWRPRLTPYRLLIVTSVVSFGISHAIFVERDKPIVPIWLDWIFSVIVVLILYLGSIYERNSPESFPWLFQKDFGSYITNLFESENSRTIWESDEQMDDIIFMHDSLPITPYRLLVSAVTLVGGISKVILSLQGHGTAANTVDWSFGIIATIFLYCLGWFEFSSTDLWSPFFAKDCGPIIQQVLSDYGPMVPATGVIYLSAKWTFMWSSWIASIWNKNYKGVGLMTTVELFGWFPGLVVIVGFADLGILVGIVATLTLMKLVLRLLPRFRIRGYQVLDVLSKLVYIPFIVDIICFCIAWASLCWSMTFLDLVHPPDHDRLTLIFLSFVYILYIPACLYAFVMGTALIGAVSGHLWKFVMMPLDQF